MPRRRRLYIGSFVTSCARNKTDPLFGVIIPTIILKVVVFPAPFLPSSPTISRCPTATDTPSTTARPEYFFTSPRVSRSVIFRLSYILCRIQQAVLYQQP